jgi:ABC-type nitrate/sulfonate/bicarbonate transport system permease component
MVAGAAAFATERRRVPLRVPERRDTPRRHDVTLRRLFLGYALGLAIGLPLGLLSSKSEFVEDTLGVLALGLQTLPSVCWIPLALL